MNTYYPPGTVCYVDKSGGRCLQPYLLQVIIYSTPILPDILGSCPEFGVSGSGIVREWKRRPASDDGPNIDQLTDANGNVIPDTKFQYSFVGPLSMSKGCDLSIDYTGVSRAQGVRRSQLRENAAEFLYQGNA